MAPFNPKINPTNDPNYGGTSRPIDIPDNIRPRGVEVNQIMPEGPKQGDTSAEYAGKAAAAGMQAEGAGLQGFGELFKNITGIGDFTAKAGISMVKKDIEDKVYNVADRERLAYTQALEQIKSGVGVKNILTAGTENDTPVPDEIGNLPETLSTLTGARDSGKISGTYYMGRLLAEAKSLRAQYPGFREEIDQQFAKVTGVNPANAYIHSLVSDINKAASSTSSQRNKTITYIQNHLKYPNGEDTMTKYKAGQMSEDDVYRWAAPYEQQTFRLNDRALKLNDKKLTREERQVSAGEAFDDGAGVTVSRSVDTLLGKMGLDSGKAVADLDSQTKAGAIPAQRWAEIGQEVGNHIAVLKTQILADSDRYGITPLIGGKAEAVKRADAALTALDAIKDRVYNKDSGGIYAAAQYIKGLQDQDTKDLLTNSKVGPYFRQVAVQKQIGGEQWLQKFNLGVLQTDVPEKYKSYYDGWARSITGQGSTTPVTMNDFIEEVKSKGIASTKLNKEVINMVDHITKPDTPDAVKINVATAAFSPENRGMISKLNVDGEKDAKGNALRGQNATFQKYTSPEVTKEMFRLGQSKPEVWTNYVDWVKTTLATELMPREIKSLSQIPKDSGVKIGWDGDNKRFIPIDTRSPEEQATAAKMRGGNPRPENSYYGTIEKMTNRMNSNLYNFKRVAESSGQDVDAFVLKTIAEAGGPEALRDVQGIPFNIMRDIGLSNMKKSK